MLHCIPGCWWPVLCPILTPGLLYVVCIFSLKHKSALCQQSSECLQRCILVRVNFILDAGPSQLKAHILQFRGIFSNYFFDNFLSSDFFFFWSFFNVAVFALIWLFLVLVSSFHWFDSAPFMLKAFLRYLMNLVTCVYWRARHQHMIRHWVWGKGGGDLTVGIWVGIQEDLQVTVFALFFLCFLVSPEKNSLISCLGE